jgi:hypothetical protein
MLLLNEDFEGIDIDDFIHEKRIQKHLLDADIENVSKINFKILIMQYLNKKLETYMAKEIISVASTEEEYLIFKEEYFSSIDMSYRSIVSDEYGIDHYGITID